VCGTRRQAWLWYTRTCCVLRIWFTQSENSHFISACELSRQIYAQTYQHIATYPTIHVWLKESSIRFAVCAFFYIKKSSLTILTTLQKLYRNTLALHTTGSQSKVLKQYQFTIDLLYSLGILQMPRKMPIGRSRLALTWLAQCIQRLHYLDPAIFIFIELVRSGVLENDLSQSSFFCDNQFKQP